MSDRGGITQDVLLRIRAQNQATADFRAITSAVNDLTSALDAQTQAAARGEVKERELAATAAKLNKAITDLKSLAALTETFSKFDKVLAGAQQTVDKTRERLAGLQAAGAKAGETQDAFAARIKKTTDQLATQEAYLAKKQAEYQALGEALRKVGVDTNNLNAAIAKLGTVFDQAQAGVTQLSNATLNYSANLKAHNAETEKAVAAKKALTDQENVNAAAVQRANEAYKQRQAAMLGAGEKDRAAEQAAGRERVAAAERTAKLQADNIAQAEKVAERARAKRIQDIKAENDASLRSFNERRDQAVAAEKAVEHERAAAADRARQRDREARDTFDKWRKDRIEGSKAVRKAAEEEEPRVRAGTPEGTRRTDALGRVGRGEGAARGLFNLRPYELTNLGYQINDIVAGFIAGQNSAQIFAQQGPQVVQIFGRAVLRWLPLVGAAAAAAAVSFGALSRAFREVSSNREFEGLIRGTADAIGYNSEQLTKYTKQIRDMGVAWADAQKFVGRAVGGGIGEGRITQIGQLAQDVADVRKVDFGEASQKIIEGLDGTRAGLMRVVDAYHLLSDPERKRVNDLFDQGKAEEAMIYALDRASARMRDAAKTAIDPTTKSVRALSQAWDDMLVAVSKTGAFQTVHTALVMFIDDLGGLAKEIDRITKSEKPWSEFWSSFFSPVTKQIQSRLNLPLFPPTGSTTTPSTTTSATAADASAASRFSAAGLKIDTESLKTLANLIAEAAQTLPPGYRVEAISTEREPGAPVAGTNTPSEHGYGRAIDIKIVGPEGDVPGYMKKGGPLYQQLDAAILELANKYGIGPIAIGSTFSNRVDAGHYSLGGSEAATNANRRGDTTTGTGPVRTGAPPEQKTAADERIRAGREQRAIEEAITLEQKRQAELTKITNEEREKGGTKEQQDENIRLRMREVDTRLLTERLQKEDEDRKQAIDNARHLNEIRAAGQRAVNAARAQPGGGLLGYDQLETIRKRGESNEADRLKRLDDEQERLNGLRRQLDQLNKGLDSKNASELEAALRAVDAQYEAIYDSQKKLSEQATDATKAQIAAMKPLIDASKARAQDEARIESARKQAQTSLQTRATLEQTYNKLAEDGAISITEAQQKIKEGYEATADSILKAAEALEKMVATDKTLSPERVAEYTAEAKKLRAEVAYVDPDIKALRKTISDSIVDNAGKAFDTVAEALGGVIAKTKTWKDVWVSMRTAAADFFAGILKDIASYIIKAQLAKAVSSFMPGLGSIFGTTAASSGTAAVASTATTAGTSTAALAVLHSGGIVGNDNVPTRRVPTAWFANAPRYHSGTVVGLGANERAAILQRGEEVVTADNPRHARNWTRTSQSAPVAIRNVLVLDEGMIPQAMAGSHGERTTMAHVTKNIATIRQMVR
jgi:hypothetical protein